MIYTIIDYTKWLDHRARLPNRIRCLFTAAESACVLASRGIVKQMRDAQQQHDRWNEYDWGVGGLAVAMYAKFLEISVLLGNHRRSRGQPAMGGDWGHFVVIHLLAAI